MEEASETKLGLIARCDHCGSQFAQSLIKLKQWESCLCDIDKGFLSINGPLWLGPIQSKKWLHSIEEIPDHLEIPIQRETRKLIKKLKEDEGLPVFSWSTHEIARRLSLKAPPSNADLIKALNANGHFSCANAIMPGQLRTNAPMETLLSVFRKSASKKL